MTYRLATPTDRPALIALLTQVDLLTDDLPDDLGTFTLVFDADIVAGSAGVELVGEIGLLRSVAVSPTYRNHQIGGRLVEATQQLALVNGVTSLYLITTTADGYFEKLGFVCVDRSDVPEAIANTRQFSDLCPDSSLVMKKKVAPKRSAARLQLR